MANNLREYLDYVFEDCEPSESSEPSKYMDTSLQTSFQEDVLEFDTTERETIRTDTIESFLEETASDLNESFNMETSHDESLPHKTGDKTKTHPITANEEGSYKAQYEGMGFI